MKLLRFLTFSLILSINFNLSAQLTLEEVNTISQSQDEDEIVRTNSILIQDGYMYYASILSKKLIEKNPESSNYNYRIGYIYMIMSGDYKKAIPHLEIAVKDTDKNYDAFSSKEKSAALDAIYYLGKAYHFDNQLDKAEEYYNAFLNSSLKKSELLDYARLNLKQVQVARKMNALPSKGRIKNLGPNVNTENPEYSPVVSLDGSAIYFTSRREWENKQTEAFIDQRLNLYPEDIYVSYLDVDSVWGTSTRLMFCEPERNEATIAVSGDERQLFIYQDNTGYGDIFYTDFYASKFNEIKPVDIKGINTDDWETHAVVSPDGNTLYFVSDRKGGYGGRDIYYMTKSKDGNWSEAKNMGPTINTEYDEDAPFISFDNKTLYFGSNGPTSMGGFDIFASRIGSDNVWSSPENIGLPYNSTNDDLFFTTTVDGTNGYLTSYRGDGLGEKDIYEIKTDIIGIDNIAVLRGKINTVDNKPLPEDVAIVIKLECTDCSETSERKIFPRLKDGVFITGLEPCKNYKLTYINAFQDQVMKTDTLKTLCTTEYKEYYKEYLLDVDRMVFIDPPVKDPIVDTYASATAKHYFNYNKNKVDINDKDIAALIKTVDEQIAQGRKDIKLEISSSASKVPTKTYGDNQTLARLRADQMKALVEKYYADKNLSNVVTVSVVEVKVDGPDYANDSANQQKYHDYQFVQIDLK